jgi:hypothetical protein
MLRLFFLKTISIHLLKIHPMKGFSKNVSAEEMSIHLLKIHPSKLDDLLVTNLETTLLQIHDGSIGSCLVDLEAPHILASG